MNERRTNALRDLSRCATPTDTLPGAPRFAHASPQRGEGEFSFQVVERAQWSTSLLDEVGKFLDSQDTSQPFQWPQWADDGWLLALGRCHGQIQWLALCGVIYPASRLMRPIWALNIHRGPVCDNLDLLEKGQRELVHHAAKMGAAYVDIAPEWSGDFAGSAGAMLERNGWQEIPGLRSTLRLSLSPSLDKLLASFRKTTRYEIRRSMNERIEVRMAESDSDCHDFIKIYGAMAREKEFPSERPEFLLDLVRWLAADKTRGGLLLAYEEGKARGGIFIVRSGVRCWYFLGATSKDGEVGVGHLLQWRAIQWAKENGCLEYDFNGYREGATSGPALFKKGFCDRVVHFIPAHRYVVIPGRYRAFETISRMRRGWRAPPI
jgi:Acetyltransferase (GNAT) domain